MKTSNLTALQEKLREIGIGRKIGYQAKFDLPAFEALHQDQYKDHPMRVRLFFVRLDGSEDYTLDSYRLSLRMPINIPHRRICGIDIEELDKRMTSVDWYASKRDSFRDLHKIKNGHDLTILSIWRDLQKLAVTSPGVYFKNLLEAKHWSYTPFIDGTGMQPIYDQVERSYCNSLSVNLRNMPATPLVVACKIAMNEMPPEFFDRFEPPPIFIAQLEGVDLRKVNIQHHLPAKLEQEYYFSSIKKAYDHIMNIPDCAFSPDGVLEHKLHFCLHRAHILDGSDREYIASRRGLWEPVFKGRVPSPERTAVELNDLKTSATKFSNDCQCHLQIPLDGPGDPGIYILPPVMPKPGLQQRSHKVKKNTGKARGGT